MSRVERRADAILSCVGWCASCLGAGAMGAVERRGKHRGLVTQSDVVNLTSLLTAIAPALLQKTCLKTLASKYVLQQTCFKNKCTGKLNEKNAHVRLCFSRQIA